MFTKKTLSVVLASVFILACGSVAVAQGPLARLARLKSHLALTDAQVNEIRDLLKKHQQAAFPLRQDMRARNHELQTALDAAEPNPAAVGQIVIARRGTQNQLRALNVKLQADIASKLTAEQKQKLGDLKLRLGKRRN